MQIIQTKLSINVNKIALIRNSRGGNRPDLLKVAKDIEQFGADGITVHPRPDERHVRFVDLSQLKEVVQTELNVEGYPTDRFMKAVLSIRPHQCTLVPDPPEALTSTGGWDARLHAGFLREVIQQLQVAGIRTSLFINANPAEVQGAAEVGADRIELYTGDYAKKYPVDPVAAIADHIACAKEAQNLVIGLNAGHDLDLSNLMYYCTNIPNLSEVSIGHALVSDSLYFGLENVVAMYKRRLTRSTK